MQEIEFWKISGSGNDFIIIDNRNRVVALDDLSGFVKKVCSRRTSVGADGLILVMDSNKYDFAWKYLNSDGSEAEMCGNGGRCAARFAYLMGISGPEMTFETLAGPIHASVSGRRVKILIPGIRYLEKGLQIQGMSNGHAKDFIDTGVPHIVVMVEDLQNYPVFEQGKIIRYHELFSPQGTNVDFMKAGEKNSIKIRTYERGVEGETLSCGTGAVASALMAADKELVVSPVEVNTSGGEILKIEFKKDGSGFRDVYLEGGTSIIYQARLKPEAYI